MSVQLQHTKEAEAIPAGQIFASIESGEAGILPSPPKGASTKFPFISAVVDAVTPTTSSAKRNDLRGGIQTSGKRKSLPLCGASEVLSTNAAMTAIPGWSNVDKTKMTLTKRNKRTSTKFHRHTSKEQASKQY